MKKAKLLALFGSVCLVLALLVTLTGGLLPAMAKKSQDELPPGIEKKIEEPVEPEIPFAGEVPLRSSVRPVLVLSGSDYDMGYQCYQQFGQIFGPWILENMQCDDFTEEEIAALKAYQWYIEEYAPEFIDMFQGMADGATDFGVPLSYREVLAQETSYRTYPGTEPPGSEDDELPPNNDGCSGFAAWGSATEDGNLICAGSADSQVVGLRGFEVTIVAFPDTGNSYIHSPFRPTEFLGSGGHPAMNNKGLVFVHHGAGTMGDEVPGYGLTRTIGMLHTVRFADDADEALAMQLAYPNGSRTTGLWADISGDAFNIDCRDPETVRLPGDHGEEDFIYAGNSCLSESLEPLLAGGSGHGLGWPLNYFEHGGWNLDDMNSVRRNLFMWNCLHNYHGLVDLDFVEMMWRFPSQAPDYPTLEEAEIQLNETHGEGWDTHIGHLANATVAICLPDDGNEGLYYVSHGCVGRQAEPLTQGYHWYQIDTLYTFYELQLAANPADVVRAAEKQAKYDMYDANKELRKLNYTDVGYAPLDEIFDKAATEWIKGDYYMTLARSTEGNESVNNWAKALRGFTACQAYAKQVYESLVPPADDPMDLGLDEWFGGWGDWETAPDGDDDSGNP